MEYNVEEIDIEKLRIDLMNYFSNLQVFLEIITINYMEPIELIKLAKSIYFDLDQYVIGKSKTK